MARRPSRSSAAPSTRSAPRPPARTPRCSTSTPPPSRASTRWWSRPTTPTAICDALDQARDAGTKVVTFDSDTDPECRDLFINQATAEGIAKVQVDLIAEQIGDEGEIAILSATANATNQNAWIEMMKAELEANRPRHQARRHRLRRRRRPDVLRQDRGAAAVPPGPQGHHLARPRSASPPRPATCPTPTYKGKVELTGLGTPNQMREYVKDGTVDAFALWNPGDLGYLAAYAAKALVDGDITGEEGDTFEAGKLGEFTVGADGDGPARRAVHLQRGQHRRLRLLIRRVASSPTRPAGTSSAGRTGHHRPPRPGATETEMRVCFQLQVKPDRIEEYRRGTPRCGPRCCGRSPTPAGTTTRCSCARTAC